MSHERQQSRKHKLVRSIMRASLAAVVLAAFVYFAYRVYASRTSPWPETRECTVIGSRVVETVHAPGTRHPLVLWQGEYHVRYWVNQKEYFLWAPAGVVDSDKSFVEDKISDLPINCPFHVQYNPQDPSESVAHRLGP